MSPVGHVDGAFAVVALLVVAQPLNTLFVLVRLVVLVPSVELHVGKVMLESVVQVNVTAPSVIAVFFILPPPAPLPFNVIVFVFAVHFA